MKQFLLPLVNEGTTWISVIASLFPVLFSAYGLFFFWPNFTKQKRIEHISLVAKDALHILTQLETLFFKAMWLHTSASDKSDGVEKRVEATLSVQDTLHVEIWGMLNELRSNLLLLRNDADFREVPDITHLTKWIESLEHMLQHGKYDVQLSLLTLELFERVDPTWSRNTSAINPLDRLRTVLLSIYEYRNLRSRGGRMHIW
jgi:hypothetical protein